MIWGNPERGRRMIMRPVPGLQRVTGHGVKSNRYCSQAIFREAVFVEIRCSL